jgi:nucleotide-binding universal stress UspA family protein
MTMLNNILVPTDFSEHSESAIDYACDLANDSSAQVHLIHVISDSHGNNGQTDKIRARLERLGSSVDEKEELALTTVKKVIRRE